MTQFDPNTFLDSVTNDAYVKGAPLPVGDYTAVIQDIKVREWVKKTDPNVKGLALDVTLSLELDASTREAINSDSTTYKITDGIMLSLTPSGSLDFSPGKNRQLGTYRDATDLNNPGETFSPKMLIGKALLVKTKLEEYNGDYFAKVAKVAKLG